MTKTIDTLVADIYETIRDPSKGELIDEAYVGRLFGSLLSERLNVDRNKRGLQASEPNPKGTLRLSNIGTPCDRLLWWKINDPEGGEGLPSNTLVKFLYGDLLESLLVVLARKAGHRVEGEQSELVINGIKGHRDFVIDGMVVDCKSASPRSFDKFRSGLRPEDDSFGYLDQLKGYLAASRSDPLVTEKNKAAFFVIEKVSGDLHLDVHEFSDKELFAVYDRVDHVKQMVASPDLPPRGYSDVEDGKSGNRKLGVNCSYCDRKEKCWPNLQTYFYSGAPRFLTVVAREPKVQKKDGEAYAF